jgi:ABC-type transport system involved in multi-copper enzyme maturation permease subunit
MTFLPIVERELRSAARRKSTRRIRVGTTVAAIIVVAGFLLLSPLFKAAQVGSLLFQIVTAYAFGLCALAGVFVTSDCLSEEKRAGTIGLLLLTDLKGAGVVVGKFIARSLNPILAWLAVLPVISLSILLGGVTGAEFWRMALVMLNTLFLSLATGICVSAWSHDAQRALSTTLGLLILLVAVLPAAAKMSFGTPLYPVFHVLDSVSPFPGYLNARATPFASQPAKFWSSLVSVQVLGWFGLIASTIKIHRAWQDDPVIGRRREGLRWQTRTSRARFTTGNPVTWLIQGTSGLRLTVWMIALGWVVLAFGWKYWTSKPMTWPMLLLGSKAVGFLLKVIFVTQVCRFFVDARRSGSLETLLCTPVTDAEILAAHWQHLRRVFLWPVVVFLLPASAAILLGESVGAGRAGGWLSLTFAFGLGSSGFFVLGTVTDILALACVGLWLALSLKKPSLAPGLTVLCVLIAPLLLFFIPDIFYDVALIAWARERLERDFRKRISEQYGETNH